MAESLAGGNVAIALLGNTIPTGAILVVLITIFGPLSGAHFNPAVTIVFTLKGELSKCDSLFYVSAQILGGVLGALCAHLMFELDAVQISQKLRTGGAQWLSEWVATFGLVLVILGTIHVKRNSVAITVGLYITAAYWFTSSTSFANPAVTIARSLTDTFSGISPAHAPAFILAQLFGALCALFICNKLFADRTTDDNLI